MKTGGCRWLWLAATLLVASAGAAGAVEVAVNLGQDDALDRRGSGALALGLEVRTDPMASAGAFAFGAGAAVEGDVGAIKPGVETVFVTFSRRF